LIPSRLTSKLWLSRIAFGNQTISSKRGESFAKTSGFITLFFERLTALRPYLAAGLPLSCAIIALRKIIAKACGNSGQLD
jgi:hypothetical protein